MAIAIMGIAFVAILGGIGTAVIGSDISRREADAGVLLRTAAEGVKGADYVACADPAADPAPYPLPEPPPSLTIVIEDVGYWHQSTDRFDDVCGADEGLQLVRIHVQSVSSTRAVSETLDVVKRSP